MLTSLHLHKKGSEVSIKTRSTPASPHPSSPSSPSQPHLQNDSSGDFQDSKQCKYKEKYLFKFSKVHKRKQISLLAKVNSRCFSYLRLPCLCPSEGHNKKIYKFVWNIMSNKSSTEYHTDPGLGQSPYLFIVYYMPIS